MQRRVHVRGIKVDRLRETGLAEPLLRAVCFSQEAIRASQIFVRLLLQALGDSFQLGHLLHEHTSVQVTGDGQPHLRYVGSRARAVHGR